MIPAGKQLPDAVYLHESALHLLPPVLGAQLARTVVDMALDDKGWNIVKFFKRDHKITLLNYPGFFHDAYPALDHAYTIDLEKGTYRESDYSRSDNPPILHRKETFLAPDHHAVPLFREITLEGEEAGLYENARSIGFKRSWERLIARKGYMLAAGRLVKINEVRAKDSTAVHTEQITVDRHLTAINRDRLSAPMQVLARHDYLSGDYSVFDYGCGKGDDVRELEAHGIDVAGWDPVHRPDGDKRPADIVNLGYVINVIEDRTERSRVLEDAYRHARQALLVSAMLGSESITSRFRPYKDGVVTSRNTFQKYYTQAELRDYIESTLDENAIASGPGVFLVFKDKLEEQLFLSERQRVRRTWTPLTTRERTALEPRVTKELIQRHLALFDDFWQVCLDLGRIPANPEFEFSDRIRHVSGSHRKAFDALTEHHGQELFSRAQEARRGDLLVYFALGLFGRRKPYTHMPESLKRDVKAFFGTYKDALTESRELLFSVGNPANVAQACNEAYQHLGCGELAEGHSLTIHRAYLIELPPILRVYIGCATQLHGDIDDIDLIKIHMTSGKVSLMKYDDFEGRALPELIERIKIKLRGQEIDFFAYTGEYEPQPLYMKSKYLRPDFLRYEQQRQFDYQLAALDLFDFSGFGPKRGDFYDILSQNNYRINTFKLACSIDA